MRKLYLSVIAALATSLVLNQANAQSGPAPSSSTAPPSAVVPPEILVRADPVYPEEAIKERKSGDVLLQLELDTDGKVSSAVVQQGLGYGMDEAAQRAAFQLSFRPATRDGKPIRSKILYRMSFTLKVEPVQPDPKAALPTTGQFRGFLRIGQSEVSFPNAQVRVKLANGTVIERSTDSEGRWEISDLPPGKITVEITSAGYDPTRSEETIVAGEELEVRYRIIASGAPLEVNIRGERTDREVTRRTMERKELALVPGTGGDAIKAVQTMPGVGRTPAFGGMIVIRGSSPYGTQTFIDGTYVPAIYHFGGLSSIVPTEMIESIDFYPGNFSAKYGRATGGIIDVKMREMDHDGQYHGMAQVDLIDARFLLRGPLPFAKNWSFSIGGRRSHIDTWIGSVMSGEAGIKTAPVYYDWQAFVETKPTARSSFRIGVFGSDDRLALVLNNAIQEDPGMGNSLKQNLRTARILAVYKNTVSDNLSVNATASIGSDREMSQFGALSSIDMQYIPILFRGDVSYRFSKQFLLRTGPDLVMYHYDGDVLSIRPPDPGEMEGGHSNRPMLRFQGSGLFTAPAAFAELEWTPVPRAKVLLGGRVDYFSENKKVDFSPRLNARYDIQQGFPRTTVKAGFGYFYEPPQITQVISAFGTPGVASNRSIHSSVGMEQQISENVEVSVEVFHKYLDNMVVRSMNDDGSQGYNNVGTGYVYGTETMVRWKPGQRFFGWIAYTASRSVRKDGPNEPQRLFEYDQSHNLTVLGSYDIGRGWRVGGRYRLVTGNPYTPCTGGVLNAAAGTYECIQGALNSQRIPTFHQLDARLDKKWTFQDWSLTAYLDVQNVYNRQNPEAISYNYNYTTPKYQTGLPIIPSLGLRGEF